MRNSEIMSLNLTRLDMCDLMIATSNIYFDMGMEMRDENTTETRRKILVESMKKWMRLHDEIRRQINEFDRQYDERLGDSDDY